MEDSSRPLFKSSKQPQKANPSKKLFGDIL